MLTDALEHPTVSDQPEPQVQEEYFGFQEFHKFYFPDKITYIEFKVLNEGEKAIFEKATQQDVILERGSGNARMRMNSATQRHEIIKTACVGWNLVRGGVQVQFDNRNMKDWLTLANPKLVSALEAEIRKVNPFLIADVSVEDIDKQIEELQEQRKVLVERDEGK